MSYFLPSPQFSLSFFFNDPATTEIYTLSLHDALPIWTGDRTAPGERAHDRPVLGRQQPAAVPDRHRSGTGRTGCSSRSEEHTSELQSLTNLVCRLLLEKKKKKNINKKLKTNKGQSQIL